MSVLLCPHALVTIYEVNSFNGCCFSTLVVEQMIADKIMLLALSYDNYYYNSIIIIIIY